MERYSIYEGHMKDLMKKVTRIKNKCEKFGCDFHFAEVGEEFKEVVKSEHYNELTMKMEQETVVCRFVIVEAEGTALLNDWEFVASVEHTYKGNIYSKALTDIEIPTRYRSGDSYCEHCNTRRRRKSTFIVHNVETGEFKQVGKSCLTDFTRGMSVAWASEMASLRDVFEEAQEAPITFGGSWGREYLETEEMLRYTAETIRHFGYAKSTSARSTRERVCDYYHMNHGGFGAFTPKEFIAAIREEMSEVGFNANSEEAKKMASDALAWISEVEASNDYMHNLKVVAGLDYVSWDKLGILVSLLPTYDRDLEKQAERAEREAQKRKELEQGKLSQFVGEVGGKLTADVADWRCVTSWSNCYNGYIPQTTYMYKFITEDGNVLIWKTQKYLGEDREVKSISGVVKEHTEFNEVKQTVLTRCKVERSA